MNAQPGRHADQPAQTFEDQHSAYLRTMARLYENTYPVVADIENEPANPHDDDAPGHPVGYDMDREQAEYDRHIADEIANTGRW